jgi:type II secretory pathway pseudopilin PulG
MNRVDRTKGFTLIELMLAMSFLAALLLAIALTIIQISTIYNHGLTLKDVNDAGATISADLQSSVSQSAPFSVTSGAGSHFITETTSGVTTGGRLCLGEYSYIWNFGIALSNNSPSLNVYSDSTAPIYFVRVLDPGANYCLNASLAKYAKIASSGATDLLTQGDHGLVAQTFIIDSSSTGVDLQTGEQLYSIEFSIGTNEQTAFEKDANGNLTCRPAGDVKSDTAYCAITTFDIVVKAGSAVQ